MWLFLLGAISRAFRPGCKFEIMLCLVGGQGAGKSSFFRLLAVQDDWFSDDLKKLDDENVYRKMQGHWLIEMSERRLDEVLERAEKLNSHGHLLDGFALCSDYCFNTNPFFSSEQFDELIVPYLKRVIEAYHEMGYYVIKHTDGNIMPIAKQMADCGPDAFHSLDLQGGVSIPGLRKIIGENIALAVNVNCGLLQTGSEEECREDIKRSLREGMERGYGYIFCTSNCAYTGLPLERYEMMIDMWREYGNYDNHDNAVTR